ncbi:MAG: methyltransferase domain-containing protein, partial [Chitinophagales bacterium]|nr:methyltransferase domain-containing protein [Chitinophagales bacterium]
MGGRKSKRKKFAEIGTFSNVLQCFDFNEPVLYDNNHKALSSKGKWKEIFGNDHPIVLELACGKGDYTVALAKKYPKKNFVGIDIKGARLFTGAKICLTENIINVRFARFKIENIC